MKIYRCQDAKEQDYGAILGQSSFGIQVKNLVNAEISKDNNKRRLTIKKYMLETNTSIPMAPSEFTQINIVLSGKAQVSHQNEKFELEEFDTAFKYAGESFVIKNTGNSRLKILSIVVIN